MTTPNTQIPWKFLIPFMIPLLVFAVGYGALQFQSNANAQDIIDAEARVTMAVNKVDANSQENEDDIEAVEKVIIRIETKFDTIQRDQEKQQATLEDILEELSNDNR